MPTPEQLKAEMELLKPLASEVKSIEESRPDDEWMVNIAHYQGKQTVDWSPVRKKLIYRQPSSVSKVRVVENRMMPAIDKLVAIIMQQIRVPRVVPPIDMSIEARNKVETSDALIRHLTGRPRLNDKANWELLLRQMCLTGTGSDFEYWDKNTGKKFRSVASEVYAGDIKREIISAFDLFPQPSRSWDTDMDYVKVRRLSDIAEIKRVYSVELKPDPNMADVGAAEWQVRNLSGLRGVPEKSKTAKYIYIHIERPSEKYPAGREIHFALRNNMPERVLYSGPNHNPNGELQVAIIHYQPLALGWSTSIASQLRRGNISYNALLSAAIGYAENATKQTLLVPSSSRVSESTLTEENKSAVRVIHYDDSESPTGPRELRSAGIPDGAFRVLDTLDKGLADMTHQHEAMRGQAPGQTRSQLAVQEVRETDLLPIQPLIERFKEMICEVNEWRLAMARKRYTERRTKNVLSDTNDWQARDFHRANLSESTQLYIPSEPNMPMSLDGKLNVLAKLASLPNVSPAMVQAATGDILRLDRIESVATIEHDHRQAQRREFQTKLLRGEPVGVKQYDNDELHMAVLDEYRTKMGDYYERLPDIIKAQVQDHYEAHKSQMLDKMTELAQIAQLQMLASGGAEAGGEAQPQGQEQPQEQEVGAA